MTFNEALKRLIWSMYDDHVKYPQLKLPDMQAERLMQMITIVKKEK